MDFTVQEKKVRVTLPLPFLILFRPSIDLIAMILKGLPWKWIEIILSFLRLHPSTAFYSFVDCDGYSISSKGFLPTVVDIMVIWVNSPIPVHLSLLIPRMSMFTLAISCLTTSNLPWFMDNLDNIPGSYAILLFIGSDFNSITIHIHNWVLFLL